MTKSDGRPSTAKLEGAARGSSPRGRRRREQLLDAGVALLTEGGWPAVTTRAVAERARANLGLVHYHWGGLPQLREAIARRAGDLVFGPVTAELLAARDTDDLLARLATLLTPEPGGEASAPGHEATARLTVELIAGAVRDPALGDVLRADMARARGGLAEWLAAHAPDAPPGTATLLVALADGLLTHHLLDPEAGAPQALDALARYLGRAPAGGAAANPQTGGAR